MRLSLWLSLLAFSLQPSAFSSTITGTIKTPAGLGRVTSIVFAPLSTPVTDSSVVISTAQQTATSDSSGLFAQVLTAGDYRVTIGGKTTDSFLITVPNDDAVYPMTELISTFRIFPAYVLRLGDTMSGYLTLSGPPVLPSHAATKGYVDDSVNGVVGKGETNTASNVGSGEGLYQGKVGVDLQFRSLVAGAHFTITSNANDITFTVQTARKGYIYLTFPHRPDGTGATIGTTASAIDYGHATFSDSADETVNFVEYRIMVPTDVDTAVPLRAKLKFRLNGTDTGTHRYTLNAVTQADGASATGTPGTPINLDFTWASGASGSIQTVGYTTLTNWATMMTADRLLVVRLARDGNASQDASTQSSTEFGLVLEYGATQ